MKKLLAHKKFKTSAAGIIFVILNTTLGWNIPQEAVYSIVGLIIAYVLGQGSADKGKVAQKMVIDAKIRHQI